MRALAIRRGVTLIELLVTLAVASLVMVAITNAFLAQTRQYQSLAGRREVNSGGRLGLKMIEENLRLAGFGVDPNLAIAAYDSWDPDANGGAGGLASDTSFPDAIVVHQRDPSFQRAITAADSGTGTISFAAACPTCEAQLSEPLYRGQILLALCSGAQRYAYVTVRDTILAGPAATSVTLLAGPEPSSSPIGLPESRFRDVPALADPCFNTGDARLVKINRYAYFVAAFDEDGIDATPRMPFLMMHRGLDLNGDGTVDMLDAVPIAAGVEQMQIAYVMNTRPGDPVSVLGVGLTPGDRVPPPDGASAWDQPTTRPQFFDSYLNARRFTSNPANIRQVRVTLVIRSRRHNEAIGGEDMYTAADTAWSMGTLTSGATVWRQLENLVNPAREFNPSGRGYLRSVMRIAVSPKNLLMRSQFLPLNYGG